MINIVICDDSKEQRDRIHSLCEKYSKVKKISFCYEEFSSGEELFKYQGEIDILLLDIKLSGIDGLKIMEIADECTNIKLIVFVSGHDEYICDVYGKKTRGFIRKPVVYEEFEKCLEKVIKELYKYTIIKFEVNGKPIFLRVEEILYLYSIGNYIKVICLSEQEYIVYGSLEYWDEQLMNYGIIRVHKSYMVNLKYIQFWSNKLKICNSDKEIPVGKKYFQIGKNRYEEYSLRIAMGKCV